MINVNYYRLLPVLLLALLVFACSQDGDSTVSSHQIRFAASPVYQIEHSTRSVVTGVGLPQGDSVGIFTYSYDTDATWSSTPDIYSNEKGVVGAYSDTDGFSWVTLPVKEYEIGKNHAFYSYYPYRNTITASDPVVNSDMFAELESDGSQTDWMWVKQIGVESSPDPVELIYQHQMTLLRFTVAKTIEVDAKLYMEDLTIQTATSQKFTFNLSSGVVTSVLDGATTYTTSLLTSNDAGELEGIEIPLLGAAETLATKLATQVLLLPQSKVTSLSFNIDGETFTTPSTWAGVEAAAAGQYYIVSIKVGLHEIIIQLGAQDWEDGNDVDLSQSEVGISLGSQGWGPGADVDLSKSDVIISMGAQEWVDGGDINTNSPKNE